MHELVFIAAVALATACGPGHAATAGGFDVGDCVGPRVDRFVQGDVRRGVPDRVFGAAPALMSGPGPAARPTGRNLAPGGAYRMLATSGGDMRLQATRYSEPFLAGTVVGWVRAAEFCDLSSRNCV